MNVQRAKEISESTDMKIVFYNGQPIYIEEVDPKNEQALVHALDEPDNPVKVSVTKLTEQQ